MRTAPSWPSPTVTRKLKDRVEPLAASVGSKIVMPLDVTVDSQIDAVFAQLGSTWGSLDILVHAVAFAPREALAGDFVSATSREAFAVAHDVSSYSLTALSRAAAPLMAGREGAILTLSYLGAVRSIPAYNVMGLAKASLEANVRFLAADLGPEGHPGQRHLGRAHQDPGGRWHPGPAQDALACGAGIADPSQCQPGGCGQGRNLPCARTWPAA